MEDQADNWSKLRSALGEESYAKLYTYLYFQKWKGTPAHLAMRKAGPAGVFEVTDPSQPSPSRSNPACPGAYGQYFDQIRIEVENNKRATAEGRKPEILLFPFGAPRSDRERAAFDIVLEGAKLQEAYYQQLDQAYDRYRLEHRLQQLDRVPNNPFPPEIEAVNQKYAKNIDEIIARLREGLGEESFKYLDSNLYPKCAGNRRHLY